MIRPRIGFVAFVRPASEGDAAGAVEASLDGLAALAELCAYLGVEVVPALTARAALRP